LSMCLDGFFGCKRAVVAVTTTLSGKGKDDKDDDNNNNQPTFDFGQFMKFDGFFRCEKAATNV